MFSFVMYLFISYLFIYHLCYLRNPSVLLQLIVYFKHVCDQILAVFCHIGQIGGLQLPIIFII